MRSEAIPERISICRNFARISRTDASRCSVQANRKVRIVLEIIDVNPSRPYALDIPQSATVKFSRLVSGSMPLTSRKDIFPASTKKLAHIAWSDHRPTADIQYRITLIVREGYGRAALPHGALRIDVILSATSTQ